MMDELKKINNKLIEMYQKDEESLKKQLLIKKILSEKNCFMKMDIETAFSILKDLEIPEFDVKNVYSKLISITNL